ncbi:hypothetical protein GGI42DRAFT_331783 [Trichoderma sp. SZMC 28013]
MNRRRDASVVTVSASYVLHQMPPLVASIVVVIIINQTHRANSITHGSLSRPSSPAHRAWPRMQPSLDLLAASRTSMYLSRPRLTKSRWPVA